MARTRKNARGDFDLLDLAIVNGSDADSGELFLMWFDAHAPLRLLVWAGSFDDAFEYAVDYLDDEGKCGIFTFLDESDYKAAAEDLGVEWPAGGIHDLSERNAEKVRDAAEADLTLIGHTTLKCQKGQYSPPFVASDEWGADEVHGKDLSLIRAWSLASDDQTEELRKLGWHAKSGTSHGIWTAGFTANGKDYDAVFYDQRVYYAEHGGDGRAVAVEIYEHKGTAPIKSKKFPDGMGGGSVKASDPMLWVDEVEDELKWADDE